MKTNKFSLLFVIAAALGALLSSGCNTVNGAGKDIEKAGDKIQDAAQKHS